MWQFEPPAPRKKYQLSKRPVKPPPLPPFFFNNIWLEAELPRNYYCERDAFKKCILPYTIVELNKLDLGILISKSDTIFANDLLKIGQPNQCLVYRIHNLMGWKLISRLRLCLSHWVNIDLIIILKTVLTPCIVLALKLNHLYIFYCTAIISQIFIQLS